MINPHLAEAHVKLISKKPVDKKLDYATIGGFTVKDDINSENETHFDWTRFDGNHFKTTNGHTGIEWTLSDFDSELFESNKNKPESLNWGEIAQSILTEVSYENGHFDEETREETHVPMVIASFKIIAYNHDYSESETYEFTPAQLGDYNKRESAESAVAQ